ncbi:MAG: peptidase MA domain-containing protein [Chloroflexi bacterium]|nr:peptidase MA domain-containing protein [Chloroflexota bacterium]
MLNRANVAEAKAREARQRREMRPPKSQVTRVLVCILLAVLVTVPFAVTTRHSASAVSDITLSSSVQISFPTSMTFKVKAQSDVDIVQLRLHYTVDRRNYADVTSEGWAQFNPATSVNAQWVWDMRKSSLPPGAQVEYWWTAQNAAGKSAETSRSTVFFDDTRYDWQSITVEPVTLLWYRGSTSFADALMTAAQQGLQRIKDDTGATPQGHVRIYIYASTRDLQGARLFPQQWEGGVTFQGFGIIAIGISPSELSWGQRAVRHELTHWVVGQITFNEYGAGLPIWLSEGLATYGEGTLSPDYQAALNRAIKNNQLISVRSLSSPFSAIPEQAYISYGQSNSIVTFLVQTYGKDKMVQLLNIFRQGSGYDEALEQVYGFDQDGLDALWRQSLGVSEAFSLQRELELAATAG